ncbi:unnamed protein product, partial [Rotaria magnacalcarata]
TSTLTSSKTKNDFDLNDDEFMDKPDDDDDDNDMPENSKLNIHVTNQSEHGKLFRVKKDYVTFFLFR